jgi:hypothetical protein
MYMFPEEEAEVSVKMISDVSVKIKEFGKPVFKTKGKKNQVKKDLEEFWRFGCD